ncbi:MAG: hypothetical protein DM484_29360 [Candidatus Methylumidiphilus alinenensis]|uniref:Uncharacterized protein n=1 Tax=Candidatus Methylumidiphilus alinenensis TaxID=2202197 RepID=A0A2W4S0X3_9GAMM|nr:MAG: hypothetical protein DM484_29360 [Candidatus Methylumidiphilus alinenensis]
MIEKDKKTKPAKNTDYTEVKRCFSLPSVLSVVNAFFKLACMYGFGGIPAIWIPAVHAGMTE